MRSAERPVPPIPTQADEVAWVSITTPLSPERLAELSHDVEAMLRLNPCYRFSQWRDIGQDSFHVSFKNESNQQDYDMQLRLGDITRLSYSIYYSHGLKRRTIISVVPAETGSTLVVLDEYETPPAAETEARLIEVDKSLHVWGNALRQYFIRQQRYSKLPGWRWYIRRLWIPMQPSSRRVVWFIWLISVAEFVVFLLVLLIYIIEHLQ